MSVYIECDNCGAYTEDRGDYAYCEKCWDELKDKIEELKDEIKELEKELEEKTHEKL